MLDSDAIRLGDLCDPARGITYGIVKVGDFTPGGVPVIRGGDIRENRIVFNDEKRVSQEVSEQFKRTILTGGELVMNLIAEPGHCALVPDSMAGFNVSRDVAVVALDDSVNHSFVNWFIKSPAAVEWMTARLSGSVTLKINLGVLRQLPIPAVPRRQQDAIASLLDVLDERIAVNDRVAATAHELAATEYALLNQRAGRACLLGEVIELAYGKALPATVRNAGSVPVYGSGGLSGWHDVPLVQGPGVVVGRKGTVGSVYWSQRSFYPIDTTFYVKVKDDQLTIEFAYFLLASLGLAKMNSDSAVPGLNRSRALAIRVQIPDGASVAAFTEQVRHLFSIRAQRAVENETLAHLRDTLLRGLMSGRLRVKDAEKVVEEAV